MSIGLGLLKRVVEENRHLSDLTDIFGIDDSFFVDKKEAEVLTYIRNHFMSYGVLPKLVTVEHECEMSFSKLENEPIGYWVDKVKRRKTSMLALETVKNIKIAISDGDVDSALSFARELVLNHDFSNATDKLYTLGEMGDQIIEAHDKRQISTKLSGIPFGLPFLDEMSDGAQGGDTIAIVGQTGLGKSYLLFSIARLAHTLGYIPLVYPLEMANIQMAIRTFALYTKISTDLIRKGRLSYWGRQRLLQSVADSKEHRNPFYLVESTLKTTVESIGMRIQEVRPHCVYIDGGYLLRAEKPEGNKRWERVAYTAEVLKTMARDFNIPIITTYQYNSSGPGLGNIGGSIAISQLASIVVSIENEETGEAPAGEDGSNYKVLKLLKGRSGEYGSIRMKYNMQKPTIEQDSVISGRL